MSGPVVSRGAGTPLTLSAAPAPRHHPYSARDYSARDYSAQDYSAQDYSAKDCSAQDCSAQVYSGRVGFANTWLPLRLSRKATS